MRKLMYIPSESYSRPSVSHNCNMRPKVKWKDGGGGMFFSMRVQREGINQEDQTITAQHAISVREI